MQFFSAISYEFNIYILHAVVSSLTMHDICLTHT